MPFRQIRTQGFRKGRTPWSDCGHIIKSGFPKDIRPADRSRKEGHPGLSFMAKDARRDFP